MYLILNVEKTSTATVEPQKISRVTGIGAVVGSSCSTEAPKTGKIHLDESLIPSVKRRKTLNRKPEDRKMTSTNILIQQNRRFLGDMQMQDVPTNLVFQSNSDLLQAAQNQAQPLIDSRILAANLSLLKKQQIEFLNELEIHRETIKKLDAANKSVSPKESSDFNDVFYQNSSQVSRQHQRNTSSSSSINSIPDKKFSHSHSPNDVFHRQSSYSDVSPTTLASNASLNTPSSVDDDDDSWKICGVCNDKATGYHFNALTCEGCKGFFRRSMKSGKHFTCPYTGNCTITKSNRRQCQACRLNKCLKIGMKKECIMSQNQIEKKKNLVISNRIKKVVEEWQPRGLSEKQHELLKLITESHVMCNNPPGEDIFKLAPGESNNMDCSSPASSTTSSHSGFSDLICKMTEELASRQPGKFTDASQVRHFSAIMEFSIKEIIKFCKKLPTFKELDMRDQITLLKSGCTEILFIKANYTYDLSKRALTCGPDVTYTKESFLQGGMSEEYTDLYLKFHHEMALLDFDDTEMGTLCALTLFSSDRGELKMKQEIEDQQFEIASALQTYAERKSRTRFPQIMMFLSRLRALNVLIAQTLNTVQKTNHNDLTQLVLEIAPTCAGDT